MLLLESNVTPAVVTLNYEELKRALAEGLKNFQGYLVTDESLPFDKKKRADLNKLRTQLSDARKNAKTEALRQFENEVEPKFKELEKMIADTIQIMDTQFKEFELRADNEKRAEIEEFWASLKFEKLQLSQIWDPRWLNKTFTIKQVKEAISVRLNEISSNYKMIDGLVKEKDAVATIQAKYLLTLDLGQVIAEYQREQEMKERVLREKEQAPIVEAEYEEIETLGEYEVVIEDEPIIEEPKVEEKVFTVILEIKATKNQLIELANYTNSIGIVTNRRRDLEN